MFRDPPGVKHINLGKYQRQIRKMLENLSDGPFETFGIDRHPLDWMGSWYRYRQHDQLKGHQNAAPMPHGVNLVYGQNQSDQTRRNQGNAKPIGAYLISSSEEELSILKPNFSFC